MTTISLAGVGKRFGATPALSDISLDFAAGSFTALLGASGCGKTTLLRLIAGFEAPDTGTIRIGGDLVADPKRQVPPEARGVGVVFQSYALWPHMTVGENIAYPLKTRRVERAEIARRRDAVLDTVGLAGFADRRIEELSGGQRQRVALARCLVADSKVILFDEPLANLDMHLRAAMAEAFRDIHVRSKATMVYVTHDQSEALALADRVVVMQAGRILQADAPTALYRCPADRFVAGSVGRGVLLSGELVSRQADMARIRIGAHPIAARMSGADERAGGPVTVLVRPEALSVAESGIPATVTSVIYRGAGYEVQLQTETGERLSLDSQTPPDHGRHVHVAVSDAWVVPG